MNKEHLDELQDLVDSDIIQNPITREERLSRYFGTSIEEKREEPQSNVYYEIGEPVNIRALPRIGRALPRIGRALPRIGRGLSN